MNNKNYNYNNNYNKYLKFLNIIPLVVVLFLIYKITTKYIINFTNNTVSSGGSGGSGGSSGSDSQMIPEDSGSCNSKSDIVDFCINYQSCCSANSPTKECLCNHPFIQNCRTNFKTCLNTNPKQLSKEDLMKQCIQTHKSCCSAYNNNLQIRSNAFSVPIKNDPTIKKLCSITSVPDIEQKCLELCTTTPNCVAYTLNTGAYVQDYGTCSLYDTISIATPLINKSTGIPIPFTSNYYTKI